LRDLEAQKASLSAADFVARRLELAKELWCLGGRRRAALDMHAAFSHHADGMPSDERVRLGLETAEMLLDDDNARLSAGVLQTIGKDLAMPAVSLAARHRFDQLHVQCANDLCAFGETLAAIGRALRCADNGEKARLEAQRAEIQMLQGKMDDAVRSLDETETA
jgi:hypothetical protein